MILHYYRRFNTIARVSERFSRVKDSQFRSMVWAGDHSIDEIEINDLTRMDRFRKLREIVMTLEQSL